ncbi:MAG TPA: formate dehydrogenase accessory protein FdhE [Vicinamibacterales bacterium]|jgi:FdhE protein
MPYVAVLGGKRRDLLETAESRWTTIRHARPELAPALELQKRLLDEVLRISDRLATDGLPRLSMPPKYLAAKLKSGVPVLAGEPVPLPVGAIAPALTRLCDALADGGAGDAALHIRDAIAAGDIESGSLLAASLARHQAAIRTGATHRGLAPDLVWLVAELAVSPFAHAMQQRLCADARDETLTGALAAWSRGYCPSCGSWPALTEVVAGHRTLRCSFCSSGWELPTYACIYCEESGGRFVTVAPDDQRKDRRIEMCAACGSYLKTMDVSALSPFPLLSISDIETTDLDLAAMEHGYQRPALKEFATPR